MAPPQPALPPQPVLVTEEYLLPSGQSVTARSGELRPGPSEGPSEGCLQNASYKGRLCSRQLWGSGAGISSNNSSASPLCCAMFRQCSLSRGSRSSIWFFFFFCAPSSWESCWEDSDR